MKLTTAGQMRELDRIAIEEREIPSLDLMERAAEALTREVLAALPAKKLRVSVFCGSGNNGGDGIAAARLLFLAGARVRVFLVGRYEKLTPDALVMTGRLSACGVQLEPFAPENTEQIEWTQGSSIVIDALLGVGLNREIRQDSLYAAAIRQINRSAGKVIAADIPSGVDADSGRVLGCAVRADQTVTFTFPKIGLYVGDGGELSGRVLVENIGIPGDLCCGVESTVHTVDGTYAAMCLPKRKVNGHKGTFGKVLAVGGSVGYTGAPYLTAAAAVRSGCGLVFLGVPRAIWAVEAVKCSSAMPFPLPDRNGACSEEALAPLLRKAEECDVLALGPGLGRAAPTARMVRELLRQTKKPVVLDADGINALEGHIDILAARRDCVTILTPHDGEFARLGGVLSDGNRLSAAREFACQYGCVLVLKGRHTLVASPRGDVTVNTSGNSGLAKGGSGDVLTGVIAAVLAQGAPPEQAASVGVYLHGLAADLGAEERTEYGLTPEDVIDRLSTAFQTTLQI